MSNWGYNIEFGFSMGLGFGLQFGIWAWLYELGDMGMGIRGWGNGKVRIRNGEGRALVLIEGKEVVGYEWGRGLGNGDGFGDRDGVGDRGFEWGWEWTNSIGPATFPACYPTSLPTTLPDCIAQVIYEHVGELQLFARLYLVGRLFHILLIA